MSSGVVVAGGGFGALEISLAIKRLRRAIPVTVISKQTALIYRPWLIKLPAGGPPTPVIPFAELLRSAGVDLVPDAVASVDLGARRVALESGGTLTYDQLVVATGAIADRDRVPGARTHALFPCDLDDAGELASRVTSGASRIAVLFGWERPGPGLEYAAWIAAHRPGVRVAAIDGDGTLERRFGERATARLRDLFVRRGGRLVNEGPVVRINQSGVELRTSTVEADLVALAAPLRGCTEWLPGHLLDARGMLQVDSAMTATPGVFGIGDVVAAPGGYRLAPTLLSIRGTAPRIARNVIGALDGTAPIRVLRPDEPDMVGPDLAGDMVLVRDRRLVMSGRLPLLIRSIMDRSYLRNRRARAGTHASFGRASKPAS